MPIPRVIHQTFHSSHLPKAVFDVVQVLRSQNPDWEYRFYDERDCVLFIRKNYGLEVLAAYNRINPLYAPARADLFRYLLMYKCGGVYLDIKSGASRTLHEITAGREFILSHWDNSPTSPYPGWGKHFRGLPEGEFQQWHIASAPEHPFLKAVIALVLQNIQRYSVEEFKVGKRGVLVTTGPIAYTRAIHPLLKAHPVEIVRHNGQIGLVYNALPIDHREILAGKFPSYETLSDPVVL